MRKEIILSEEEYDELTGKNPNKYAVELYEELRKHLGHVAVAPKCVKLGLVINDEDLRDLCEKYVVRLFDT